MNRRTLLLMVLLAAAAAVAGALLARRLGDSTVALQAGTWLPRPRALAEFHLMDLSGREFNRASLLGHPTLLFFGFTNCPDICPVTLAVLGEVERHTPLPGTQVVFVSIDPQRDSPSNLQVYLGTFSKDFVGVRGEDDALAPLLHSLGAIAARVSLPDGTYTMDHSATLYLLDTQARLVAVFSPPFAAPSLAADLHQVALAHRM